jgi:hypothetical protein
MYVKKSLLQFRLLKSKPFAQRSKDFQMGQFIFHELLHQEYKTTWVTSFHKKQELNFRLFNFIFLAILDLSIWYKSGSLQNI